MVTVSERTTEGPDKKLLNKTAPADVLNQLAHVSCSSLCFQSCQHYFLFCLLFAAELKLCPKSVPYSLAAEEGLASPYSIPGWEKNVLWFIGISLNQSQSSWVELSTGVKPRCHSKIASGRNLFWWNVCTFKSCFSRAKENSDWTDSLARCLDLPCRDLRSS